jgi:hypothetical protein
MHGIYHNTLVVTVARENVTKLRVYNLEKLLDHSPNVNQVYLDESSAMCGSLIKVNKSGRWSSSLCLKGGPPSLGRSSDL